VCIKQQLELELFYLLVMSLSFKQQKGVIESCVKKKQMVGDVNHVCISAKPESAPVSG